MSCKTRLCNGTMLCLKMTLLASVWEQQWKNGLKSPCCFSALEFKEIHDTAVVSGGQTLTSSSSKEMVGA